jgi:2-dehydropantoate 2-reductase
MNILIIGAGALGKSLAALLSSQADITVYERDAIARQRLAKEGFIFKEGQQKQRLRPRVIESLRTWNGQKIDVLIFATKVMDLRKAVAEAISLKPQCVFFPQNGIFDFDWTRRFLKTTSVCRGVTTMACQETAPAQVTLFFRGNMYLGGDGAPLIADLFRKCGIETKVYSDPSGSIWAKLVFSAVMNPLPVVTGRGYEVLRKDEATWKLVQQAIEEGRSVARSLGVRLAFNPLQLIRRVRNGDLEGITYRGSIFKDFRTGRRTELDFITGALIRQGRKSGIKTPALDLILAKAKAAGA